MKTPISTIIKMFLPEGLFPKYWILQLLVDQSIFFGFWMIDENKNTIRVVSADEMVLIDGNVVIVDGKYYKNYMPMASILMTRLLLREIIYKSF